MGTATGRPRGRPPGSKNKRTAAVKEAAEATRICIEAVVPGVFTGDAHAFLMTVYKDPVHPIDVRLDAAGKAIRYEKPALSSVESKSEVKHVIRRTPMTPRDWAIERAGQDADDLGSTTGPADRPH